MRVHFITNIGRACEWRHGTSYLPKDQPYWKPIRGCNTLINIWRICFPFGASKGDASVALARQPFCCCWSGLVGGTYLYAMHLRLGEPCWLVVFLSSYLWLISACELGWRPRATLVVVRRIWTSHSGNTRTDPILRGLDLPYESWGQPYLAWFGLISCSLIVFFSGESTFPRLSFHPICWWCAHPKVSKYSLKEIFPQQHSSQITSTSSSSSVCISTIHILHQRILTWPLLTSIAFYLVWKFFTGTLREVYIPAERIDLGEFDVIKSERAEAGLITKSSEETEENADSNMVKGGRLMRLASRIAETIFWDIESLTLCIPLLLWYLFIVASLGNRCRGRDWQIGFKDEDNLNEIAWAIH